MGTSFSSSDATKMHTVSSQLLASRNWRSITRLLKKLRHSHNNSPSKHDAVPPISALYAWVRTRENMSPLLLPLRVLGGYLPPRFTDCLGARASGCLEGNARWGWL
mmetsp:Transcript_17453/g.28191  ORF Transcript_17453/g.28191 Transcript_17453/m.28191 type:complete len:106 (-) Transcript_17453:1302-1619(-)